MAVLKLINWRSAIACTILALQILATGHARFVPTRYLCWAPYDEIVFYEIAVELPDGPLTQEQVKERYRIPKWGRSNRSWAHVTDVVAFYETTSGRGDGANTEVRYTVNGRGPFAWNWPEQHPHDPGIEVLSRD